MKKNQQLTPEQTKAAGEAVGLLAAAVDVLQKNGFDVLNECAVFCAAAIADAGGTPGTLRDVAAAAKVPYTTASRLIYELTQRGLLYYDSVAGDRRKKLIRANLGALK